MDERRAATFRELIQILTGLAVQRGAANASGCRLAKFPVESLRGKPHDVDVDDDDDSGYSFSFLLAKSRWNLILAQ